MTQPPTPAPTTALTLTPPEAVAAVAPEQAATAVPLGSDVTVKLDAQVSGFVGELLRLDVHSEEFRTRLGALHSLGDSDVRASASVSNRMLERPVGAMERGGISETSTISTGLVRLRNQIEELDPSRQGDLFSPRRLLGLIPFGSRIRDYFDKYRSSQTHLNAIIDSLYRGQDELRKDNAAIEQEKTNLWALMQRLQQWVYIGKKMDATLTARVAELEGSDKDKAKIVKEELLFAVRQKVMDLLTQLAVNSQGYMALDLIRRNNLELIKGVDRATTTTVSALRTAVIVAQALSDQKLVLDQITALNTTTGNLIESTGHMLKEQTGQIYEQATSSTIKLEQLQSAFRDIYATMDMITEYKSKALTNMSRTVDALTTEVDKARQHLDRIRSGQVQGELPVTLSQDGVVQLGSGR